jgi:hypothetical protein
MNVSCLYSHVFNYGSSPSASSLPILPVTAGGLLIPFQPSNASNDRTWNARLQTNGVSSNVRNFDRIRQQIQQRARLLEVLQQQQEVYRQIPSLPIFSANSSPLTSTLPARVGSTLNRSVLPDSIRSSLPVRDAYPSFLPSTRLPTSSAFNTKQNDVLSSDSSNNSTNSSSLTRSSTRSPSSGMSYSQANVGNIRNDSIWSGNSTSYRKL